MQTDYDNDLQSYFTDMEYLRDMFKDFVSAEKLPKRLIVFHGVGGVGKSSLLRMFRLHCKSEKIPVALASGDDAKSTLDVITRWMEDLKADGVKFSSLTKTLESYRAVQAKVEDQAKKSQNRVADIAGKAASKTVEAAGGALLGAAIGSIVPGVGTAIGGMLGSAVGGMGAEALTDWLRGFLDKSAIDLLLDPAKKLTSDFLEDLAKAAEKKRIVLLLDTYEQMSALEDWVGEAAQKTHPNVLMVIAGRKLPDWNRVWSGWMMNAQVEELKPMTEEIMRQLIHRYYATMRGGEPDPAQVDAIIKFARGLPMVVTSAVQLWVKYGVEDFQSVKAEIVANLVDRLMEGVPSNLLPALEAAAVVRWFDQPILRAVTKQEDVRDVYNELRRFPFVRTRIEGLALHDSVREMIDENLRMQDSERYCELHQQAAVYFEKKLVLVENTGKKWSSEWNFMLVEYLFHTIYYDDMKGITETTAALENALRLFKFSVCERILNELTQLEHLSSEQRDWLEYFRICLADEKHSSPASQTIAEYKSLANVPSTKLRCFVAERLAIITYKNGNYLEAEKWSQIAIDMAQNMGHQNTSFYAGLLRRKAILLRRRRLLDQAIRLYEESEELCMQIGDRYGLVHSYQMIGGIARDMGQYDKAISYYEKALNMIKSFTDSFLESRRQGVFNSLAQTLIQKGNYHEAINYSEQALQLAKDANDLREEVVALSVLTAAYFRIQEWNVTRGNVEELQRLATQHGFLLHLAWALLFKGHMLWDKCVPEWENGFDAALWHYKRALICALWFNCSMLDQVLSGQYMRSPLQAIVPYCLAREDEGQQMLIALRDWWKTGVNTIGMPRPDTISPIPEGIPLLEAEKIAREREPGDESKQRSVVEQLEAVL